MDDYRELRDRLTAIGGKDITIYQGIVKKVHGCLCDVEIGRIVIPGVRLRASETEDQGAMLLTPKIGTAVTVGSLSGDLSQLVVLQVDHIESIVINGGKLGGLINIEALTDKINELIQAFNNHTHQVTVSHPGGTFTTVQPASTASTLDRKDIEDVSIKH